MNMKYVISELHYFLMLQFHQEKERNLQNQNIKDLLKIFYMIKEILTHIPLQKVSIITVKRRISLEIVVHDNEECDNK